MTNTDQAPVLLQVWMASPVGTNLNEASSDVRQLPPRLACDGPEDRPGVEATPYHLPLRESFPAWPK